MALLGAPFLLPAVVAVFGIIAIWGRGGLVSAVLQGAGASGIDIYGLTGVVLAHVFFNLPLAARLMLQGWLAIPAEQFRLAAQLGFAPRDVFRRIEAPMLRDVLPGAFVLVFLLCMTSFAVALTLGGGPRATTVELAIYQALRFDFDLGRAAWLALIQFALCGSVAFLALRLSAEAGFGGGLGASIRRWDADRPLLRALDAAVLAALALFLGLPLGAVLLQGLPALAALPASVWPAAARSLGVALASAALSHRPRPRARRPRRRPARAGRRTLARSRQPDDARRLALRYRHRPLHPALPHRRPLRAGAPGHRHRQRRDGAPLRPPRAPSRARRGAPGRRPAGRQPRDASASPALRLVTWPRLRRPMGLAAGLAAALSMGDLGVIALFAPPELTTLPLLMQQLMAAYRTDAAAGVALVLIALTYFLFWAFDRGGRIDADA